MERNVIAVIGGTGKAGKYIVIELLSQGFKVRMLARHPEKVDLLHDHLQIVEGNATDSASIVKLVENCSALISTLGPGKDDDKETDYKATVEIVKALENSAVSRYIFVTGLSIDALTDRKSFKTKFLSFIMRSLFPTVIRSKQKAFDLLSKTGIQYTMIRIPLLDLKNDLGTVVISLEDVKGSKVAAGSLAKFAVSQIEDDTYMRKAPFVATI